MKRLVFLFALVCFAGAPLAGLSKDSEAGQASASAVSLEEDDSLYDLILANRLSIGLAISSSSMKKKSVPYDPEHSANFLGNINKLDESDMTGVGIVVRYELCPYVALQFSNDLYAELGMWNHDGESRDANFVIEGNTYEVLLMYPIDSIYCTPYIGLGWTDLSCSIEYNNWWHLGWDSLESYNTYSGGTKEPRNNITRWILVDDPSSAFTYSVGVSLQLFRHAQVDLFYRAINSDDATLEFRKRIKTASSHMMDGYVPTECSMFGASVRFVF